MDQVNSVVVHTSLDPYLTLQALADYSGLSQRTLRRKLRDPWNPLPHYVCGDRILVRVSAFDRWIEGFRVERKPVPEHLRASIERVREAALSLRLRPR
jgi:Helix-turn-helix domain